MMTDAAVINDFHSEDFVLLLSEEVSAGWWDKETHKITYSIVIKLTEYSFEVK